MWVLHILDSNIHFEVKINRKILFKDFPFFDDWGLAILKMCSMFIGEVDFGDLYQEAIAGQGRTIWLLSSLIYLSFVFMVVIVLTNLLNGLAVSDVGIIAAKADIDSSLARLEIIAEIESIRHRYIQQNKIIM